MTIKTNDLVLIKGKIGFSRILKMIEGEELQKYINDTKAKGRICRTEKPHTFKNMYNVKLIQKGDTQHHHKKKLLDIIKDLVKKFSNPENLSDDFKYIRIFEKDKDGEYIQIFPTVEPASDQEVMIQLNAYVSQQYPSNPAFVPVEIYFEKYETYKTEATITLEKMGIKVKRIDRAKQPIETEIQVSSIKDVSNNENKKTEIEEDFYEEEPVAIEEDYEIDYSDEELPF